MSRMNRAQRLEARERRAPREMKIKKAIVLLSSWQTALGAIIIGMSFTVFACSTAEKLRNACPYWAGFTVLFTGSVGFLTWKQLSIVSIGIYTFLSAVSVIVHLVGTVLTGDSAGFLKSFHTCAEVKFEHACGCCVMNDTCKLPYKFPGVRDCAIINGVLKDMMYGLCAINVVCCLICLGITVMGCTLVAQYSQYSQSLGLRWHRHSGPTNDDHGYNWLAFPSAPSNYIPPCAPPIYYPGQTTAEDGSRSRRPPTVFDPVDFPPPYCSREPSLSGRQPHYFLDMQYSLVSSGPGSSLDGVELGTRYQSYELVRQESGNGSDHLNSTLEMSSSEPGRRELGSTSRDDTSGTSRDTGGSSGSHGDNNGECSTLQANEGECGTPQDNDQGECGTLQGNEDESAALPDNNGEGSTVGDNQGECSTIQGNEGECSTLWDNAGLYHQVRRSSIEVHMPSCGYQSVSSVDTSPRTEGSESSQRGPLFSEDCRRHSSPHSYRADGVYHAHDEIYHAVIAHNINPWSRFKNEARVPYASHSLPTKRRANSIPSCVSASAEGRVRPLTHKSSQTAEGDRHRGTTVEVIVPQGATTPGVSSPGAPATKRSASAEELGEVVKNCKESKKMRSRRHCRRKRPRHNPGHILEHESGKDGKLGDMLDYRETRL